LHGLFLEAFFYAKKMGGEVLQNFTAPNAGSIKILKKTISDDNLCFSSSQEHF
jgi:hypothetical protein